MGQLDRIARTALRQSSLFLAGLVIAIAFTFISEQAAAQRSSMPPVALPTDGLIPVGKPQVQLLSVDATVGTSRVSLVYEFQNQSSEAIKQGVRFEFPPLVKSIVDSDPNLAGLRRSNFLNVRVRQNGERVQLGSRWRLDFQGEDVTPETEMHVSGDTLSNVLDNIADDISQEKNDIEIDQLGLVLEFLFHLDLEPNETASLELAYRPYSAFFVLDELFTGNFGAEATNNWRNSLTDAFCLNYPENADVAEFVTDPKRRTWIQTTVLLLGNLGLWENDKADISLTLDPYLYDREGKISNSVNSHLAFCGRQLLGFDSERIARFTSTLGDKRLPFQFLFLHSSFGMAGEDVQDPYLAQALSLRDIFVNEDCRPANGLLLPCSDVRPLGVEEVSHLSIDALLRAQFEMLARKGAYFVDPQIQSYFERFFWYEPHTRNPELNTVERENTRLLERVRLNKIGRLSSRQPQILEPTFR